MSAEAFSNGWIPRPFQAKARSKVAEGIRRLMLIWHRRAGKDAFSMNLADELRREEVGTYWHLFPLHTQAKKAIWYGIGKDGRRFIDQAFPVEERAATRGGNDLMIEFENGSIWQMCGSDKYDSLVGSNPRGVFFSEFALCDPRAWDFIRPIIRENGGFVVFITTYRGRNHAYRMAQRLKNDPDWYVDVRSVEQTSDNEGRRILTPEDIEAERREGMSEALIQQEYFCNPMAAMEGAVYGRSFEQLAEHKRIGSFQYDPSIPVTASWSLEFADQYTVLFAQSVNNETRIVGSESVPFASLGEAFAKIDGAYPWGEPTRHVVPPETSPEVMELFERQSKLVEPAPDLDAVKMITRERLGLTSIDNIARSWTDGEPNNENLVDALNGFRFKKLADRAFSPMPANTWEKHFARAVEVYSLWRHHEPDAAGGWHPAPDMTQRDRAVI